MTQDRNDRFKGNIKADPKRAERLEAELRENLKRRKARSRAASAGDTADPVPANADALLPHPDAGKT